MARKGTATATIPEKSTTASRKKEDGTGGYRRARRRSPSAAIPLLPRIDLGLGASTGGDRTAGRRPGTGGGGRGRDGGEGRVRGQKDGIPALPPPFACRGRSAGAGRALFARARGSEAVGGGGQFRARNRCGTLHGRREASSELVFNSKP